MYRRHFLTDAQHAKESRTYFSVECKQDDRRHASVQDLEPILEVADDEHPLPRRRNVLDVVKNEVLHFQGAADQEAL